MPEVSTMKLYDSVLVVELQSDEKGKNVPFISYKYPSLFEEDPFTKSVSQFCFPDLEKFPVVAMPKEIFSFVLTDGDGERRFGYCLRKLANGTGPRYPFAFSIMAYFPCFPLYKAILDQVAIHYENSSMSQLTEFVDSILKQPFPAPGKMFEVNIRGVSANFTRPRESESLLKHIELDTLLNSLSTKSILTIFASLLVERRMIFCSSQLSKLSSCIQAAVAMLYPFMWQHIYIPVLPRSLLSFVCAPMPFVVGILETELEETLRNPMDEALLFNIDKDEFILAPGGNPYTDLDTIPAHYLEELTKLLKAAPRMISKLTKKRKGADAMVLKQLDYEKKVLQQDLNESFTHFFVHIIGSYPEYMRDGKFHKEEFLSNQPEEIQGFLENLMAAQMFEVFLDERLDGEEGGFEKMIENDKKMQTAMAKFGIDGDKLNGPSTLSRPKGKRQKGARWGATLRSQFKRGDNPATSGSSPVIGIPTFVATSTERSDGTVVAPPIPPRLPPPPAFEIPSKPLPVAPKIRSAPPISKRNTMRPLPKSNELPPNLPLRSQNPYRNTWKPQIGKPLGGGLTPPTPIKRGRGGGGGSQRARPRPMSVRPGTTIDPSSIRPLPMPTHKSSTDFLKKRPPPPPRRQ